MIAERRQCNQHNRKPRSVPDCLRMVPKPALLLGFRPICERDKVVADCDHVRRLKFSVRCRSPSETRFDDTESVALRSQLATSIRQRDGRRGLSHALTAWNPALRLTFRQIATRFQKDCFQQINRAGRNEVIANCDYLR